MRLYTTCIWTKEVRNQPTTSKINSQSRKTVPQPKLLFGQFVKNTDLHKYLRDIERSSNSITEPCHRIQLLEGITKIPIFDQNLSVKEQKPVHLPNIFILNHWPICNSQHQLVMYKLRKLFLTSS